KIAAILSVSALCDGKKLRGAATHRYVNISAVPKLGCDLLGVARLGGMCVKGRARRIGEFRVRYESCGPSIFACLFNDTLDRFPICIDFHGTIRSSPSRRV